MFGKLLKDKKWLTAMVLALIMTSILSGSLEKDKIFQKGDRALVTISHDKGEIKSVVMTDHYRLNKEIILLTLFGGFLVLFAGKTGISAIFSFVITILMIWKVLIPSYLKGYSPVWIEVAVVTVLTIIIIYFVFGPNKKTLAAAMGTMTTTLLLAYSGGYIALLMVFMAQGTPIDHILNYKYVAAEILDTVVGCFGLVLVAPFTAMTAGILLARKSEERPGQEKV